MVLDRREESKDETYYTRHTESSEDILHREDILCKTYRREESSGQEREALGLQDILFSFIFTILLVFRFHPTILLGLKVPS